MKVNRKDRRVDVIVPYFGDDIGMLRKCLEAISKQNYPNELIHTIVVDNNTVPTLESTIDIPNVTILYEHRPGSYAARNAGVLHSRAPVIAFTDADCIPDAGWISESYNIIYNSSDEDVIVAGKIEQTSSVQGKPTIVEYLDIAIYLDQKSYVQNGYATTANIVVPAKLFDTHGLFDADSFSSGDRKWTSKAIEAGVDIIYANKAVVKHRARSTLASAVINHRRRVGGAYMVRLKDGSGASSTYWAQIKHFWSQSKKLNQVNIENRIGIIKILQSNLLLLFLYLVRIAEVIRLQLGGKLERR